MKHFVYPIPGIFVPATACGVKRQLGDDVDATTEAGKVSCPRCIDELARLRKQLIPLSILEQYTPAPHRMLRQSLAMTQARTYRTINRAINAELIRQPARYGTTNTRTLTVSAQNAGTQSRLPKIAVDCAICAVEMQPGEYCEPVQIKMPNAVRRSAYIHRECGKRAQLAGFTWRSLPVESLTYRLFSEAEARLSSEVNAKGGK